MAGPGQVGDLVYGDTIKKLFKKGNLVLMMDHGATNSKSSTATYTEEHLRQMRDIYDQNYSRLPINVFVGLDTKFMTQMFDSTMNITTDVSALEGLKIIIYSLEENPCPDPVLLKQSLFEIVQVAAAIQFIVDPVIYLRSLSAIPKVRFEYNPSGVALNNQSSTYEYLIREKLLIVVPINKCQTDISPVFTSTQSCMSDTLVSLDYLLQVSRGGMLFVLRKQTFAREIPWKNWRRRDLFLYVELAKGPGYLNAMHLDNITDLSHSNDLPYVVGFAEDPMIRNRTLYWQKELTDLLDVLNQAPFNASDFGVRLHAKFLCHKHITDHVEIWQPLLDMVRFKWLFVTDGTGFPDKGMPRMNREKMAILKTNIRYLSRETFLLFDFEVLKEMYIDDLNDLAPTLHTVEVLTTLSTEAATRWTGPIIFPTLANTANLRIDNLVSALLFAIINKLLLQ